MYVLAASAYTAWDFKKMLGSYPGKCYKFAYFPKHPEYDLDDLYRRKEEKAAQAGATTILWEGRMIRLKRADLIIKAAAILVSKGYDMRLKLIGDGDEKKSLIALSEKLNLQNIVSFEGFLAPDEARERMADAQIYVCTSNFLEGWGSVIYEALGVGCAVVASHACGATPWLVKPGKTGFVYKSGDAASLADKLEILLKNEKMRLELGKNAYEQMHQKWNPKVAAKRVIELGECLETGHPTPFTDGPCSKAEIIKNNWYSDAK
jgi:glycosyltransferase involved in cell wall biosynthesis